MKKYNLKNLDCASCASKLEAGLSKMEEVKFVSVNFANLSMTIDTIDIEKVKARIKKLEPEVVVEESGKVSAMVTKSELAENKWTLIKAGAGLLLLLTGLIFEEWLHNTPYEIAEYAVFISGYLIVRTETIDEAVELAKANPIFKIGGNVEVREIVKLYDDKKS